MTAFAACRGPWGLVPVLAAAILAGPRPAQADPIRDTVKVHLDQARIVKLPEHTATLVIGNPLIADVAVQPGGIAVLTAKSHGATNLVALDRSGATLMEDAVQVVDPNDNVLVVLYRGVERESYSCTPECGRRITVGDSQAYYTANLTQVGTLNGVIQGPAAAK